MLRILRLSLAQTLLLVALAAFVIVLAADFWRKRGTGVTSHGPVLAVSPEGQSLAMNVSFRPLFQHRHPLIVQDLRKPNSKPRMFESHSWIISDLAWFKDGTKIVTCSGDHTIRVWDVKSGEEIERIEEASYTPGCLALSPDERFIAFGDHPLVNVWDVTEKKLVASLKGLTKWVESIAFSPSGDYLVAASIDGKVQIWDTASWALIKSMNNGPPHLEFTPDGRLVSGGVRRATGKTAPQVVVAIYDIPSLEVVDEFPIESYSTVRSVALSRDGTRLAAGHSGTDRELGRRAVTIWDLESRKQLRRFEFADRSDMTDALEFSANGETLYGASRGGRITELSWRSGQSALIFARPALPWKFAIGGLLAWLVAWRFAPRLPRQVHRVAADGKVDSELVKLA